jgi:ELWxxDGT repeat protein
MKPTALALGVLLLASLSPQPARADNSRVALVKDINPGAASGNPGSGQVNSASFSSAVLNGLLFFPADDGVHGIELWRTDGTPAGTSLFKDIEPGPSSSEPWDLMVFDGALMFTACTSTTGCELWKSDGTPSGTAMIKDINPGSTSAVRGPGFAPDLTAVNGTLFFVANDGPSGPELWKTDGTVAGTVLVKDITPGNPGSGTFDEPIRLTSVNGTLFFAANDLTTGTELWKSDGTTAGTVLVADLSHGAVGSDPQGLVDLDGILLFTVSGSAIWRSDGTATGTQQVAPIGFHTQCRSVWAGVLYMQAGNNDTNMELWKTDGTAAGTVLIKDINPGTESSTPCRFTELNGELLFSADSDPAPGGAALWKTDGTADGTVPIKTGLTGLVIYPGGVASGTLYMTGREQATGQEVWRTDGTTAGTFRLTDFDPGPGFPEPIMLGVVGGTPLFKAGVGAIGRELWKVRRATSDFDGDGIADVVIYRPGSSEWWINRSLGNFSSSFLMSWGLPGDQPVPADFDGDGKVDPAMFRPAAGGGSTWFVRRSSTNYTDGYAVTWGTTGDVPVPGYYDGDRLADAAVFRPSTGQWLIAGSTGSTLAMFWGTTDDVPVPADYDGDGRTDIAIYRPSTGQWLIKTSTSDYGSTLAIVWGVPGEIPIPGDHDGDGQADLVVYRPDDGAWFVAFSSATYTEHWIFNWGVTLIGDLPVPADFDGDGKIDPTVYRQSTGAWFILRSRDAYSVFQQVQWGLPEANDLPIRER